MGNFTDSALSLATETYSDETRIFHLNRGRVELDGAALRRLRHGRLMSQQDLAEDCWRRNIRVSLPTIKRAELGRAVRFRIARELARCFDIPVAHIVRSVMHHDSR
jgi:DNA-binding XRE family transcriptional regulator